MSRMQKTKGQFEAEITAKIAQFERDHLGRGPRDARTFIVQDMVLIRLKGILTPAEQSLATSTDGAALIKQTRMRLVESSRMILEQIIDSITGCRVVTMHTDLNTSTGERVFVFCLDSNLEEQLV